MTHFKNLIEITQYFSDNNVCVEYLTNMRWKGNVTCAHCKHDKVYELKGATKAYKCAKCRKLFSVTKGTIFENSPIPLQKWFIAMYLLLSHKKGISSCQLAKDISISQKSAWFLLHRIRFAVQSKSFEMPATSIVECDESYFGGKEKNKHKSKRIEGSQGRSSKTKTPVFGLVERNGRVVAMKVPDTQKHTIQPIIDAHVVVGAKVMTDEWQAYKGLDNRFKHGIVKHGEGIYVIGEAHTNTIEGFWSQLKRSIYGCYHQCSAKHLDAYIDESETRYNTKDLLDYERFENVITLTDKRLTYSNLTNGK